ncbi:MAG: sel1 repeat family protein, partial [Deltaproteobacteria bacterium]|nr:sel1 repeat family protein [Deltaproteobacteria bacterium]
MKFLISKQTNLLHIVILMILAVSIPQKAFGEDTQNFTISVEAKDFRSALAQAESEALQKAITAFLPYKEQLGYATEIQTKILDNSQKFTKVEPIGQLKGYDSTVYKFDITVDMKILKDTVDDFKSNIADVSDENLKVGQDDSEKVKRFRKAADQGDPEAQFYLGVAYYNGEGVPQDYAKAAKWYRKAADQGIPKAQLNLGYLYYNGEGVPQDYAEAVKWYRKAADQGIPEAQFNLGVAYGNGKGV